MTLGWFKDKPALRQFCRKPGVSGVRHGDKIVLMDVGTERFYSLDVVGARVWELLGEHSEPGPIADVLVAEFAVPAAEIRRDVDEFLDQLTRDDLVRAPR